MRRCEGCGCRLSRYNDETSCTACSRRAREAKPLRPSVPEGVWSDCEVQQALAERDFGSVCLLVRRHGALRQEDLAMLTGLGQPFLSMLESGARRLTNIDKIITLLDGLGVPIELTGPMLRTSARPVSHGEPSGLLVVADIGAD
ncbi:helix-turn-helix domain-containing protein [Streptomyces sp. NPDC048340]|uniref:helix-turn-helix domain-containing protein n=1 Tax=Streptomyces sp. NPDC048340 TaxID=3365537 RepID=UPI00372436B9